MVDDAQLSIGGEKLVLPSESPLGPEDLFCAIRSVWGASERLRVWAALALAEADSRRDWAVLGFESFQEYVADLGIPTSTGGKLKRVGRVFGRQLIPLIEGEADPPCTERLSIAAQRVDRGQVDVDAALEEAMVHPIRELLAMRNGEPELGIWVKCPECGHAHRCSSPGSEAP
jgi:hypothetical protein